MVRATYTRPRFPLFMRLCAILVLLSVATHLAVDVTYGSPWLTGAEQSPLVEKTRASGQPTTCELLDGAMLPARPCVSGALVWVFPLPGLRWTPTAWFFAPPTHPPGSPD